MQEQVSKLIIGCILCNTSKPNNRRLELCMPLPTPSKIWKSISMDYVGYFPKKRIGHDHLFEAVDQFNKMCVLIPCKETISTHEVVDLLFVNVRVHFGFPSSIVFDQDFKLVGKFWTTFNCSSSLN